MAGVFDFGARGPDSLHCDAGVAAEAQARARERFIVRGGDARDGAAEHHDAGAVSSKDGAVAGLADVSSEICFSGASRDDFMGQRPP